MSKVQCLENPNSKVQSAETLCFGHWNLDSSHNVLVIGAGPAGLALGYELKRRGISFLILERGATAGHCWQQMPTGLKLVSPWKANRLPGSRADEFPPNAAIGAADYSAWLRAYAREHALPVQSGLEVRGIIRGPDGVFRVQAGDREFISHLIVNATGYFSNPFVPRIPGACDSAIPQRHTAHYKNAQALRALVGKANPLVLIVGKRLSAGQTMVELIDAGFKVALSCRGHLQFGAGPLGWWIFFRIHPWLERLKLKVRGAAARGIEVRMPGGRARRLVENGAVQCFPEIVKFEKHAVLFTNGTRLQADAVIYATGFRPALNHLASLSLELDRSGRPQLRDLESISTPGLYFIGLDQARNFQSRFIRGIRQDAAWLAERLERRLAVERERPRPLLISEEREKTSAVPSVAQAAISSVKRARTSALPPVP
jgi:putative flavoprotein involved in K+ transport